MLSVMGSHTFSPVHCCLSGMQDKGHRSSSVSKEAGYPDFYVIFKKQWFTFTKTLCRANIMVFHTIDLQLLKCFLSP